MPSCWRMGGRYASLYALQSLGGEPAAGRRQPGARAMSSRGPPCHRAGAGARPPRAVVGSQINTEEQIFAAFDGRIVRRFWGFISPYRRRLVLAVLAVLAFAASQIAIPLILRPVIDDALVEGARGRADLLERSARWSSSRSSPSTSSPTWSRRRWSRASPSAC